MYARGPCSVLSGNGLLTRPRPDVPASPCHDSDFPALERARQSNSRLEFLSASLFCGTEGRIDDIFC